MLSIERNQELLFENLFSFRLKATRDEINRETAGIEDSLRRGSIRRTGPVITSTISLELIRKKQILDVEILFPVDRSFVPIAPNAYCAVKPVFHLVNALRLRVDGGRQALPAAYNQLVVYMIKEGLRSITPMYNVALEADSLLSGDEGLFEVYVGVDPSRV